MKLKKKNPSYSDLTNQLLTKTLLGEKEKDISNFTVEDDLREKIKQIIWENISSDWRVERQFLNPNKSCSKGNPLYKHEEWLRKIYYDDDLNLSIRKICKIGMTKLTYS